MGPIGHAAYPRNDPTWVMPPVRKRFELFATIRPSRSYPTMQSIHKNVDIVFVREPSEGMLYSESVVAGLPEFRPNDKITVGCVSLHATDRAAWRAEPSRSRAHSGLCVGERRAMAQATHGSAPDIAGRDIANPCAMIVSGPEADDLARPQTQGAEGGRRRRAHAGGNRKDR